jgi:hypothetical protein
VMRSIAILLVLTVLSVSPARSGDARHCAVELKPILNGKCRLSKETCRCWPIHNRCQREIRVTVLYQGASSFTLEQVPIAPWQTFRGFCGSERWIDHYELLFVEIPK